MNDELFSSKLELLAQFGYQIAQEKNLDKLVELLAEQARQILDADRCSIFIVDKNKQELWSKVAHDINGRILYFPISQGVAGFVARTGNTANVIDAYSHPYFNSDTDQRTGYITKSILAMPMKNSEHRVLGVFQVLNKRKGYFTGEDEGILTILGSIAAAAIENAELYANIKKGEYEMISRLALVTQLRDKQDLAGHLRRMSEYSKILSLEMGLPEEKAEMIRFASLLHDIGKVGVPDNILLLNRQLTESEYEQMKMHTIYGAKVLEHPDNDLLQAAHDVAVAHHENYDGSGYPFGLRENNIPLVARIVSVADVFDALMSRRVYKESWELTGVIEFITGQSGKKFDPNVVDAFFRCLPKMLKFLEQENLELSKRAS